jgi:nucleoside-diphosphate-sugar epimerase
MIMVSRNSPVALLVGAASCVMSFTAERLLEKDIQVIAVDDLHRSQKHHLDDASKSNRFHLLNYVPLQPFYLDVPRVDYLIFDITEQLDRPYIAAQLEQMVMLAHKQNAKILLVSSVEAYDKDSPNYSTFISLERRFARLVKHYKVNARLVRLSAVYGARMSLGQYDPLCRLLHEYLLETLNETLMSSEFITRSISVHDAVDLIAKSLFHSGTNHKIYDAIRIHPLKISELAQVLQDPLWFESRGFSPTPLPAWTTPNAQKTQHELHWQPHTDIVASLKDAVVYLKSHPERVPKLVPKMEEYYQIEDNESSMSHDDEQDLTSADVSQEEDEKSLAKPKKVYIRPKINVMWWVGVMIIVFGLLYPMVALGFHGLYAKYYIQRSGQALSSGDFDSSTSDIILAEQEVRSIQEIVGWYEFVESMPKVGEYYKEFDGVVRLMYQTTQAAEHTSIGTQKLYQSLKMISGSETGDIRSTLEAALVELSSAQDQFGFVQGALNNKSSFAHLPGVLTTRLDDLELKVGQYSQMVGKARTAAFVLPKVIGLDSQKKYLVLLQNNMELRPGGGFIGSYAVIDFEGGKLKNIKVDDIYNLDGNLKTHIEPPTEIKYDLGQKDWYLRDSNFDPDFPTSARQAMYFYNLEAGEKVSGVIAMDLSSAQKLLTAVGPLDLADYQEKIDQDNLFDRAITHAEVSFFPGSQSKKNFITSLQTEVFNHLFFLNNQNWPAIIGAVGESLEQKHVMVYLSDSTLFSYLTSQGWGGVFPRGVKEEVGERRGFLAVNEANFGANKSNYYLQRTNNLHTTIGKDGEVSHILRVSYLNQSPSDVWPAGKYKNRLRIYLPGGTKLNKASWDGEDITKTVTAFSEYGRSGYSLLVEVGSKEKKELVLEYQDASPLQFKDGKISYSMDIIKQAGILADPFEYSINLAKNMTVESAPGFIKSDQQLKATTDMLRDRSFQIVLRK